MFELELSAATIAKFHDDGFVILDRIIDEASVALLRERFDAVFSGTFETGLIPDEVNWQFGRDDPLLTRQICNAWKADRWIASVILDPAIGRACAQLGAWPGARINQDNLFWKPEGAAAIGFHQDESYEQWVVPSSMVSCWIALDDTTANGGSVEYVRGSHRWHSSTPGGEFHAPREPLKPMQEAAERAGVVAPERVPVVVPAGGGAFHHGRTWHGSLMNESSRERRSIVAHSMSSEARHHPRNLGPVYSRYKRFGDPSLDESFFPIVWREDGYRSAFIAPYTAHEISWGGSVE